MLEMRSYQKGGQKPTRLHQSSSHRTESMDAQHPQAVARRVLSVAYGSLSESDDRVIHHDLDAHRVQPIAE